MQRTSITLGFGQATAAAFLVLSLTLASPAWAQPAPNGASPPSSTAAPLNPNPEARQPGAPAPSNPNGATGSEPQSMPVPEDGPDAAVKTVDVPARPVAIFSGKADWDSGFVAIVSSLDKVRAELAKAGLQPAGRPFAVFLETDDKGFQYEAMIPIDHPPAAKDQLSPDVKFGLSPAGKALKFEHRGPYNDIDATYEAITAYLDEKGLEAQDLFIEEYLTDTRQPDDAHLAADIYIFIK